MCVTAHRAQFSQERMFGGSLNILLYIIYILYIIVIAFVNNFRSDGIVAPKKLCSVRCDTLKAKLGTKIAVLILNR